MKIRKGDKVQIIAGKDKGKTGVIEKVIIKQSKVLIPGVNIYKKHIKKNEKMPQGGIVELPRALDISKVMFVCPKCSKNSRVGYLVEKGKKLRICKSCKSKI